MLRPPAKADVPAIVEACQDPELARFIPGFPSPYTARDARRWVASRTRDRGSRTFLIVDSDSGSLYGAIELRLGAVGSVGYWVVQTARGRGIATQATKLVSRWAVTEGGVERLELTTHPENIPSQRVAEKAGFTREGVLRAHMEFPDGRRRDSVMFSLLPSDLGGA